MVDRPRQLQELEHLRRDREQLESQAGIAVAMARAREGRFIPEGASGEQGSPAEHFADEYDHLREGTRDAYFSVTAHALRKELIGLARQEQRGLRQREQQALSEARAAVAAATQRADRVPWLQPALAVVVLVGIGWFAFATPGAIAGAVCGYFLGQALVAATKRKAKASLDSARAELADAVESVEEEMRRPEWFSADEETSGQRDSTLDHESARVGVVASRGTATRP